MAESMEAKAATADESEREAVANAGEAQTSEEKGKGIERREIKGGLPYTNSPGIFKKALELIIQAERPDKFGANYMATILKLTGGAARTVPPLLKKMQFIGSDGAPTILYSKFKTDSGRSQAAYEGLKNAFSELFKRNEYIHKADEGVVRDTVVEITGLKKNDQVVRYICATFDSIRSFITGNASSEDDNKKLDVEALQPKLRDRDIESPPADRIGLSYQINIVLPETENISVFNAIFKSLRENLLR